MIRIDHARNKLVCDGCEFTRKLYSHNSISIEQERSKEQTKHECSGSKIVAPPVSLDDRWKELFQNVSLS